MNTKQISYLAAAALACAPLAVAAQSLDVTAYQEAANDEMIVEPFNLPVNEVEDMDLKSADGEDIGEVEKVLTDASGQAVAVTVEVGGFLGIGEREVVLGLDELQLMDDHFVTSVDKAMIEASPDWKD